MHRKNIEHVIEHGTLAQMQELKDVLVWIIDDMKVIDKDKYMEYEMCIHKIVYGCHLSKELAECWVSKMQNKDGSKGGHWTYEQTEKVMTDKGLRFDANDWYASLNMVYSDFYNPKFDLNNYIDFAKDWIEDTDVGEGKTLKYYFKVVKG